MTHEVGSQQFSAVIRDKVSRMPGHNVYSVIRVGAGRFHSPGRSKEGDSGIKCSTRVAGNEWPNLMIEVGDSEQLRQLRYDVQWWLLNSGGRTNLVILVQVEKEPKNVIIEVWELVPNPDQRTRFASPTIPAATTRLSIDGAGVVAPANGSLVIPYDAVFDNLHPDAAPIILTTAGLTIIAHQILSQPPF